FSPSPQSGVEKRKHRSIAKELIYRTISLLKEINKISLLLTRFILAVGRYGFVTGVFFLGDFSGGSQLPESLPQAAAGPARSVFDDQMGRFEGGKRFLGGVSRVATSVRSGFRECRGRL
ncbi:MAG: hypothetical protein JW720_14360, partial [Sedimentisphaerales bacterium]|nr:hypothetical protein [Sedimentisphaerales bacterium]